MLNAFKHKFPFVKPNYAKYRPTKGVKQGPEQVKEFITDLKSQLTQPKNLRDILRKLQDQ